MCILWFYCKGKFTHEQVLWWQKQSNKFWVGCYHTCTHTTQRRSQLIMHDSRNWVQEAGCTSEQENMLHFVSYKDLWLTAPKSYSSRPNITARNKHAVTTGRSRNAMLEEAFWHTRGPCKALNTYSSMTALHLTARHSLGKSSIWANRLCWSPACLSSTIGTLTAIPVSW